jgi:hypothetical protein
MRKGNKKHKLKERFVYYQNDNQVRGAEDDLVYTFIIGGIFAKFFFQNNRPLKVERKTIEA